MDNARVSAKSVSMSFRYTDKSIEQIRVEINQFRTEVERKECRARRGRAVVGISSAVAGAAVDHFAHSIDIPEIIAVAMTIAPEISREIIEYIRRI